MRRLPLLAFLLVPACVDRTVSKVEPIGDNVETFDVPTKAERDIDILFVIDNSQSMTEEHASLRSNFGTMLDRLDDVQGGLPNVHLGVVSSDMGTTPFAVNSQCTADGGDGGLLHGATCAALAGNTFIEDVLDEADGSRVRNYTGALQDAFGCAADVGANGCGFEQHLAAMKHALSPGVNPGFVRDDALLGVVILADEDDCSASDPRLYDPNNTGIGPITDFRCHTQGIICDNDPNPAAPGPRTGCVPNPDSVYLEDTQAYVDFLVDLKGGHEERVIVAGIIGDPDRVEIGPDPQGRPSVLATCPTGGLGASEPGIRFDAFLSSFGHGRRFSLCTGDLGVALGEVADVIVDGLVGGCLVKPLADTNGQLAGVQHECSVVETVDGQPDTVFPSCDVASAPCYRIAQNDECDTAHHQQVVIDRGGVAAPERGTVKVQCVVE